jgi:hypothetical protein
MDTLTLERHVSAMPIKCLLACIRKLAKLAW